MDRRDHGRDFRRQPDRKPVGPIGIVVFGVRVVATGYRNGRSQSRHWRHRCRQPSQKIADLRKQRRVTTERVVELVEFLRRRKFSFEEQVRDFFETTVLGQVVDRVAAIEQDAGDAVHKANGTVGGHHSLEALDDCGSFTTRLFFAARDIRGHRRFRVYRAASRGRSQGSSSTPERSGGPPESAGHQHAAGRRAIGPKTSLCLYAQYISEGVDFNDHRAPPEGRATRKFLIGMRFLRARRGVLW